MGFSSDKINLWFDRFDQKFAGFAGVIAETAVEFYRERFEQQNWEGQPWQPLNPAYAKRKTRGSGRILTATGILAGSIWPSEVSVSRVRISAGGRKAPYAKIHNEGGTIKRPHGRRPLYATGTPGDPSPRPLEGWDSIRWAPPQEGALPSKPTASRCPSASLWAHRPHSMPASWSGSEHFTILNPNTA